MGRIGFIGIGIMGSGMVGNLLADGHEVVVWNRTAARLEPLVAAGATAAASPADLGALVDTVMICVSDTPDVAAVVFGDDGLVHGLSAGDLVIDHSTISPVATKQFAERVAERGAHWLDAPISGGSEGAANGTLSIMVGGDAFQLERAMPFLEAVGATITHVGPQGAGQLVKAVNQILVVVTQLGVSEALLLAQAGGLDLDATLRAVGRWSGGIVDALQPRTPDDRA